MTAAHADLHGHNRLQQALRALENFRDDAYSSRQKLKTAQETLDASRDLYAELYDFAPVGYVTLDISGIIENANYTVASMLRTDRARMLGHPFINLVVQRDWSMFLDHRTAAAAGRQVTGELDMQMSDGRTFPVQIRTRESLLPGTGHRRVFLTSILNLSEVRRNEAERLRLTTEQQKARLAAEAKDRFLAVLSHELRTPLTPILAVVSDPHLLADAPPHLRDTLKMIARNIGIEVQLVEDLLDVSRVTQGKLRLSMQPTDLHQIIIETVELLRGEAQAAKIDLRHDLRADHYWVQGDPTRLRQVLWNLIRNAIKFTPAGGRILTRSIDTDDGKQITVSVRDTGIGIDPSRLGKLFTAFEQINPAPAGAGHGGLGLGLTICRGLVTAHGGQIVAHSEGADTGSTFEFTIATIPTPPDEATKKAAAAAAAAALSVPLTAPRQSDTPAPRIPAHPRTRPLQIILVEDHPDTAFVMAKLLQRQGHQVAVAHTYKEALDLADAEYDLAISDISLPDGSGLDLMRRLRKSHEHTRGIALSGLASEADVQRAHDAGFDQHLAKPINFDQLLSVIDRLA